MAGGGHPTIHDELSVETYLTSFKPHTAESAAIITSDLEVYSQSKEMVIQLEGLTVSSFTSTKPHMDYELYLHTVFELDPDDEIVTLLSSRFGDLDPFSIKGSKPMTQQLPNQPNYSVIPNTPPRTPINSETQMPELVEITALPTEKEILSKKSSILPFVSKQAQLLPGIQKHVSRVVQQISHKYPRMRILDLTDPDLEFTQHVLERIDGAFSSYRIACGAKAALCERLPTLKGNNKIKSKAFDLSLLEIENDTYGSYDLVILSASVLQQSADQLAALKDIRKIIRNAGYLVFIDMFSMPLFDPSDISKTSETGFSLPGAPPDWPHWLEDECDFAPIARNCDQHYPSVASICVRQAGGREISRISRLRPKIHAMKHLLIVGGKWKEVGLISSELEAMLRQHCDALTTVNSLEELPDDIAGSCTAVILLVDLDQPICTSMTSTRLESLKCLVRPELLILWVTINARDDPDQASSLGLTRSLKAEIPNLTLQVLDLDRLIGSATLIFETFVSLCSSHELSQGDQLKNTRRHIEPELHVGNGRLFIPRVVPYRPAIDRLNAYRRVVTRNINILETSVQLQTIVDSKGFTRYSAEISDDVQAQSHVLMGSVTVRVEYSSLKPVSVLGGKGLYVFAGRRVDSRRLVVGLSKVSASIVQVQPDLLQDVEAFTTMDTLHMITVIWNLISAIEVVVRTGLEDIVLVEPDQTLLHCVRHLMAIPTATALTQQPRRLIVLSGDKRLVKNNTGVTYVRPWSTAREVRSALPLDLEDCTVINFLDHDNQLTRTLATMHGSFEYENAASFLFEGVEPFGNAQVRTVTGEFWRAACAHALEVLSKQDHRTLSLHCATPSHILENATKHPTSMLIDWVADPSISIHVKPLINPRCLRKDRTYVLVGLTRDLGQSICRLFLQHGARNIVVASRNPDMSPVWVAELNSQGANIHVERLDVIDMANVQVFKSNLAATMPTVGGVVNAAMVLDDRVLSYMDIDSWMRVMRPKAVGSKNLDTVFDSKDIDFFIMTSSFAAIGGHAGQSNYAAANMYMNGLAMNRRQRGLAASALNIGVIYGLGLLAREDRQSTYSGLERDGYPPISERDLHHMFMEAIEAGRPVPGRITDLTTGLARYRVDDPNPLHWHLDRRFCHFTIDEGAEKNKDGEGAESKQSLKDLINDVGNKAQQVADILLAAFCRRVEAILQHPAGSIVNVEASFAELGVDSLAAVEIRNWVYKAVGQDVPVMKILGSSSILKCKRLSLCFGCKGI